jgi:hypothetical protein
MITPEQIARESESSQQQALMQWAALNVGAYPQLKWLYAVPNGFFASPAQKGKMKAEGLKNGVPDLFLPVPFHDQYRNQYGGLYIELKVEKYRTHKDGGCSKEQLEWLAYLENAGYKVKVCYGWIDARDAIVEYLNGE